MQMSVEQRREWEESLKNIPVLLASSKEASVQIFAEQLGIPLIHILGIDPEEVYDDYMQEPKSDTPKTAILFKLRRVSEYKPIDYRETMTNLEQYIAELQTRVDKEKIAFLIRLANLSVEFKKEQLPDTISWEGLQTLRTIYNTLYEEANKPSPTKNRVIFASDVVARRNGVAVHRPERDASTLVPEKKERESKAKVMEAHRHPTRMEWIVSFGVAFEQEEKVLQELYVEANFPRIRRELAKNHLALKTSPGIELVELAEKLGVTFTIRNSENGEKFALSLQQAYQLIVLKSPLHRAMLDHLLFSKTLEVEGSNKYRVVNITDSLLQDWLNQSVGSTQTSQIA